MTAIGKNTSIRIGLVVVIIAACFGAVGWIDSRFDALETKTSLIDKVTEDNWTLSNESEQALRTAINNPKMQVPDPRNPGQIIQVRKRP